jgi:hypothetical protein
MENFCVILQITQAAFNPWFHGVLPGAENQ